MLRVVNVTHKLSSEFWIISIACSLWYPGFYRNRNNT